MGRKELPYGRQGIVVRPLRSSIGRVRDAGHDLIEHDHVAAGRHESCVQLQFHESEDGTMIDGLVGPHPNVWTLFAFVNITIITVAGFGLMLGAAQLTLDRAPWGLWTVLAGAVGLTITYFISQAGRRLAADQTRLLIDLVEDALATKLA